LTFRIVTGSRARPQKAWQLSELALQIPAQILIHRAPTGRKRIVERGGAFGSLCAGRGPLSLFPSRRALVLPASLQIKLQSGAGLFTLQGRLLPGTRTRQKQ
jgi:hypothetical protein